VAALLFFAEVAFGVGSQVGNLLSNSEWRWKTEVARGEGPYSRSQRNQMGTQDYPAGHRELLELEHETKTSCHRNATFFSRRESLLTLFGPIPSILPSGGGASGLPQGHLPPLVPFPEGG
jgi:hypothetical protein